MIAMKLFNGRDAGTHTAINHCVILLLVSYAPFKHVAIAEDAFKQNEVTSTYSNPVPLVNFVTRDHENSETFPTLSTISSQIRHLQQDNQHPLLMQPKLKVLTSPWDHIKNLFSDFESEIVALDSRYCGHICKFKTRLNIPKSNYDCDECSCAENCQHTGHCCPDLVLLYKKTPHLARYPGCMEDRLPVTKFMKYYLIVSQCPVSYNITRLKVDCEKPSYTDWLSVVPRVDDLSGTSFRNIYCAQCHGQNNTSRWSTSVTCSSYDRTLQNAKSLSELFNATMSSKMCSIHFDPPPHLEMIQCRKRHGKIVDRCNVTGAWRLYDKNVAAACSMYSHVVNGTYRNVFCYLCNTKLSWRQLLTKTNSHQVKPPMTASLTSLIDFNSPMESIQNDARTSNYNNSESMIAYLKQCQNVSVSCSEGKHLVNDRCLSLFYASNTFGYRVCFQTNITFMNSLTSSNNLFRLTKDHHPQINSSLVDLINVTAFVLEIQNCPHKKMYAVVRYLMFVFSVTLVNRDQFEQELMGDQMILTDPGVHIRYQGGCNSKQMGELKIGDWHHCSAQFRRFVLHQDFPISDLGENILRGAKYLQLNKQLNCPVVVMNPSHYSIQYHDNKSSAIGAKTFIFPRVSVFGLKTILKDEDFQELDNGSVVVCVRDYVNATLLASICNDKDFVTNTALLGIFSFVCTSVSLLFLAITFLTYCVFASLRTIAGVCNMGLIVTMFAAQTVFELGLEQNEDVIGCQVIGICNHFLWMAAIFWMNACTFLLFLKLSYPLKCRNFDHNSMKIFFISALYCNGSSVLIVGLNVIINIALHGDIGYGGHLCYLNNMFSTIYFFKIPMGIIIMVNIGLFLFTICNVRHRDLANSTQESKINLFPCVKLSVITGLVWLSSYLYEIFKIEAFAYLFTLLVGSQGVLIFVAIVVNRNVLSLWTSCLLQKKNHNLKGERSPNITMSSETLTIPSKMSESDTHL